PSRTLHDDLIVESISTWRRCRSADGLDQLRHLPLHFVTWEVAAFAVAGQYPLEAIRLQQRHRPQLIRPRIPADILRRRQASAHAAPPDVVSREEVTVLMQ